MTANFSKEILPIYRKCPKCAYDLVHEDYFLCLLEAGRGLDHLLSVLNFVIGRKECCKNEYKSLKIAVKSARAAELSKIQKQLEALKTVDSDVRADAIYYLLMRGCGVRAACHLTRSPRLDVKSPLKGDCKTCGNTIPNKNYIKALLNERDKTGIKLTHYLSQYDIPRQCCLDHLYDGDIKTEEPLEPLKLVVHQRGVPTENLDFILCTTCGLLISGCADDSSLPELEIGAPLPPHRDHISGDSIRQAARWGLPMEIGYICHKVYDDCCQSHITCTDVIIMASDAFDEKTRRQNFAHAVYIST